MIRVEFYITRKDGVNLYRTYSDEGYQIRKIGTNEVYAEAIDIEDSGFLYEETNEHCEIIAFYNLSLYNKLKKK